MIPRRSCQRHRKKICIDKDPDYKWFYEICIVKGNPTYKVIQGKGTMDASSWCFKSDNLKSNTTDTLIVVDKNGCEVFIPISHNCDCGLTTSGSMDLSERTTCIDDCILIEADNNHVLENNDCVKMIFHADNGFIDPSDPVLLIQDYDPNNGNTFCFDKNIMEADKTYYVSYVVAECDVSGVIKLKDFCLRRVSTPVKFLSYPKANAGVDKSVCSFSTILNADIGTHKGQWDLLKKPSQSAKVLIDNSTNPNSEITVNEYGIYTTRSHPDTYFHPAGRENASS